MAVKDPSSTQKLDTYGAPDLPWSAVRDRLAAGVTQAPGTGGPDRHTSWLATVNPDGTPHVRPLGALWDDGTFVFNSGAGTRKAKNLAREPKCVLTVATLEFDLIVEGQARRVTDLDRLRHIAELFAAEGWPARVDEDARALTADYSAPTAGPPPWPAWELTPETVYGQGTVERYGSAKWRF
jgi:hypothetical protein